MESLKYFHLFSGGVFGAYSRSIIVAICSNIFDFWIAHILILKIACHMMIIPWPIAKRITSQIVQITNSELNMICLWVFNQLLVHCLKTGFIFWLFFLLFLAKEHLDPQLRIIHTQWLAASMRGASQILLGPALRLDEVKVQSPRIGRCGVRLLQCDLLIFKSFQKQWRGGRGVRVITHWKH